MLGFSPGDDRTIADWSQITDYFARLDKASDRVLVQTIGETTLKRPIIVAAISARENILALDKYKVLFGFRPQHRGQTWGTFPFIWNAIATHGG